MPICKECGKNVAILASGVCPHGRISFDFCDECYEKIYNEIFMDEDEEEDESDECYCKCMDPKGVTCFACTPRGECKILTDTRQIPCPFYKTVDQILEKDPNYFTRGD